MQPHVLTPTIFLFTRPRTLLFKAAYVPNRQNNIAPPTTHPPSPPPPPPASRLRLHPHLALRQTTSPVSVVIPRVSLLWARVPAAPVCLCTSWKSAAGPCLKAPSPVLLVFRTSFLDTAKAHAHGSVLQFSFINLCFLIFCL